MTTRLIFHPDAAAHSAKNAPTAPGSTAQSRNRTEEPQMVDTTAPAREAATFTYTPDELNSLISREVSGRLHELGLSLMSNAAFLLANDTVPAAAKRERARVYLDVSAQLRLLAVAELDSITGEVQ
ncbi:hypothetical protein SAMN05421837_10541 [Amycolatopsis pretoriensis]|uniref:Uncharacterized protein n=1 Tax=Amycolatopsis pretoriensis TaxID=218821 RepID=A0A1H5QWF7_9PSEU|nr:hypothetical protein [Amycolatopsis pretoriensis]SEF30174.1 hypothetical protein SAMN05421837_10541 [Amycolatopsis pretoriensis]